MNGTLEISRPAGHSWIPTLRSISMIQLAHTIFRWITAGVVAYWVSMPAALPTLIIFMGIDYATGILCASIEQRLSSDEAFKGLKKKLMIFLMVTSAHLATKAAGITYDLGSVVAIAYIISEWISVTENCARAGIPVPKVLVDALAKAKGIAWNGNERRQDAPTAYVGEERRERSRP